MGKLNWLYELFDVVCIPQAVYRELQELIQAGHNLEDLEKANWLKVKTVQNQALV